MSKTMKKQIKKTMSIKRRSLCATLSLILLLMTPSYASFYQHVLIPMEVHRSSFSSMPTQALEVNEVSHQFMTVTNLSTNVSYRKHISNAFNLAYIETSPVETAEPLYLEEDVLSPYIEEVVPEIANSLYIEEEIAGIADSLYVEDEHLEPEILEEDMDEDLIELIDYDDAEELVPCHEKIPASMYLHMRTSEESSFFWAPDVLTERISEEDIHVNLSSAIDESLAISVSNSTKNLLYRVAYSEAGNQPFLGLLLVGEDLANRIRYYPNSSDIVSLLKGYGIRTDENGNLLLGSYYSDEAKEAVDLALSGSNVSGILLEAVTEHVNNQYGLELGEEYYSTGAFFHFSPDRISGKAVTNRSFNRAPVSFQYEAHIFYGHWLNSSAKLDIDINSFSKI